MIRFQGLIFDMDGTLTRPRLDFGAMRREIGLAEGTDLLRQIAALPPERRRAAWAVIESHEARAMREQQLQDGAFELLRRCRRAGIRLGILTRNARVSVDHLCRRFDVTFDAIVTREFPHTKPHPAPALSMLATWALPPHAALMIGDYGDDIACGRAAGTVTCFYRNPGMPDSSHGADHVVSSMRELGELIFPGLEEGCRP